MPSFFPEKRQFFLENAGVFNFPLGADSSDLLFFSRQIGIDPVTGEEVPINGGAKVTGSLGNFQIGAMDVETRSSGPNPYANYAVLRVKRSLWGGSYIGAMGIDKRSGNPFDSFNQTEGIDTRLVFLKNLVFNAYATQTRTPGFDSGQTNVGAGFDYETNWLEVLAQRAVLREKQEPVALADQSKGLINTKSVMANAERLSRILENNVIKSPSQQSGRYLLSFDVVRLNGHQTRVKVTTLIILDTASQNPLGGQPLRSNGVLETEHLKAIEELLAAGK